MTDLHKLNKDELIHLITIIQKLERENFEEELKNRRLNATFCNDCEWFYISTHKWQKRRDGYCNYCAIEDASLPKKDDPSYWTERAKIIQKRRENRPVFPNLIN